MSEAWIALIGTIFGGTGFKLIEFLLGRAKRRLTRNGDMWDEVEEARRNENHWRNKYYALVAYISAGDLEGARRRIRDER